MKKHFRFFPVIIALTNMKRLYALAVTIFLSIFLVVAANATTAGTSDVVEVPQGIQNLKKVMKQRIERDKKMHVQQEKGQAKRMAAQSGK